jgi:hypothetical protein
MRKAVFLILLGLAAVGHARVFSQAELDALLAPIALHPDAVVNHVMIAAAYPDQVAEAARGAPQGPHWHPSVSELLPYPELLQRMAESPQWMRDLSEAFITQQPAVMQTVEGLRARAQNYAGVDPGPSGVVYGPSVGYVRYYDPLVVFGPWWWPAFYPVVWHPWYVYRPIHAHHVHHHGFHHSHVLQGRSYYRPGGPIHNKPVHGSGVRHAPSLPSTGHGPKPGNSGPRPGHAPRPNIQHKPQSIAGSGGGGFLQMPQNMVRGNPGMPSARAFSGGPGARGFNGGGGGGNRGFAGGGGGRGFGAGGRGR